MAMAISSIDSSTVQASAYSSTLKSTDTTENEESSTSKSTSTSAETGVIYEKSSDTSSTTTTYKANSSLVAKLKADAEQRTAQLQSLVQKMMTQQGQAYGKANSDSIWSFLAGGNFTVDAATKAQAQADIADDGYWGVEQTSDRILDFAKALSGGDPDKADELLAAFDKGFKLATGSWGKDLPDISQRTYDAVHEKFEQWKKEGTSVSSTEETEG